MTKSTLAPKLVSLAERFARPIVDYEWRYDAAKQRTIEAIQLAAPEAAEFLRSVVGSSQYSDRARVDAAKTLLDRAGYLPPPRQGAPELPGDDIAEMTPKQLRAFIARTERELADRAEAARDVTPHPSDDSGPTDSDVAGYLADLM